MAPRMSPEKITEFIAELAGDDIHAMRVWSLANGVIGVVHSATLGIASIGAGLAAAQGLRKKHSTKQVDRLLSNEKFPDMKLFERWVPYIIAEREEIVVALDWTEFAKDKHATISLYLVSNHGRATPLIWKTHDTRTLKDSRNDYEDELLKEFIKLLPDDVHVTVLADRGFGDQNFYTFIKEELGMEYAIRFKGNIMITDSHGEMRPAREWLHPSGRAKKMNEVRVTAEQTEVPAVLLVHAKKMKDPWFIATSRSDLTASQITKLYGRRFTIEETFRDIKDHRFGMGLSMTSIKDPGRRDRLLFLAAMSHVLFTMLGMASERSGYDRYLKTNTSKKRTHSLFNLGRMVYTMLPTMREDDLKPLMKAFGEILTETQLTKEVFGVL
ncbi:IS4 family transposase [Myxococcota bacterium]|nr:IS4 family transposase [Myxococcota bacterium]MBU1536716.1 IS4 family transposase [Myxococcota bacterium]